MSPYTGLIVLVDEPRGVALGTHCQRVSAAGGPYALPHLATLINWHAAGVPSFKDRT